jgi:hypothetical protein
MVVNSGGVPFFTEFGSNKLASIDPSTLKIREYALPHAGSRPRRIAITSDDVIWYSDYARGALGRRIAMISSHCDMKTRDLRGGDTIPTLFVPHARYTHLATPVPGRGLSQQSDKSCVNVVL